MAHAKAKRPVSGTDKVRPVEFYPSWMTDAVLEAAQNPARTVLAYFPRAHWHVDPGICLLEQRRFRALAKAMSAPGELLDRHGLHARFRLVTCPLPVGGQCIRITVEPRTVGEHEELLSALRN